LSPWRYLSGLSQTSSLDKKFVVSCEKFMQVRHVGIWNSREKGPKTLDQISEWLGRTAKVMEMVAGRRRLAESVLRRNRLAAPRGTYSHYKIWATFWLCSPPVRATLKIPRTLTWVHSLSSVELRFSKLNHFQLGKRVLVSRLAALNPCRCK
jgi:hypothetical protein